PVRMRPTSWPRWGSARTSSASSGHGCCRPPTCRAPGPADRSGAPYIVASQEEPAMVSPGALDGIRVLGVEHFISGPFCTQILADQGADVIKVESPHHDQRNGYFHTLNRNKRSIVLDLRTDRGRQIMRALVVTADVLVTNFGAGVPDKLGFG